MDYEKAYKEALERAKEYLENSASTGASMYAVNDALKGIFPELAESEDERIRKWLLGICKNMAHACRLDLAIDTEDAELKKELANYEASILYLEKQKDIKLLSWRAVDECKDIPDGHYVVVAYNRPGFFALDTVVKGKLSNPNRGDIKATGVFYIPNADENCMCIIEKQKINTEGDFARGYDCGYECCLNSHGAEWFEKQKEQKPDYCHHEVDLSGCSEEYRKGYYDGWNNCNQQHSQLEADQKPAEWSEEDKKMLNTTLSFFPILKGLAEGNMILGREGDQVKVIEECWAWLKSLRPQPHWKPSEEQMEALNTLLCVGDFSYVGQHSQLQGLYNELKKL